ncbi:uncharacterized protein LOC113334001 [Papaver somniferum]|uniref:uncharacterized protein LOC113334001 n=1 Tax=Papaver somniferum TaxID=3469 RepID=UPI000E7045E9|nr:uncharacterized protein LOC113334001 [Papaver somniferum]
MIIHNSSDTSKGNIWLFWNASFSRPVVVSSSSQAITVKVGDVMVTGIHAACLTVDKRELWEELIDIIQMNYHWMIIGDFNVVFSYEETFGGRRPLRVSMQDIRDCLESCNLIQATRTGIKFSWCNNKDGKKESCVILIKLFIILNGWRNLMVGLIKYQQIWTSHPGFLEVIKEAWNEVISGNPTFSFFNKLKRIKQILNKWNWEVFGDLRVKVKSTEDEVLAISLLSDTNPENIELLNNLVTTRGKHEIASHQYNELTRAKSRAKWIKEGGANTSFFHTTIKLRQSQNNITELESTESNVVTEQVQIGNILVAHYTKKFGHQNVTIHEEIMGVIPKILNDEDNKFLDVVPTAMEIKEALFGMNANSAPSLDGFLGCFYKFAWEIIGEELVEAIQYCWNHIFIPNGSNSNFIFLLPKIQGARRAEQYRPIGLENFNFKIFTRIITTRISTFIERLVSPQQGAFIKGRNIHDKIVLASEMINELNIKRRGGNVGLKLDITQAFDFLSWEFLFEVLRRFGFSEIGISWIRKIFESAMISVLVNGGPCGFFFGVGRGLRQGDTLSHILFILAEEVLRRNLSKLVQESNIQAMVTRELPDTYLGVILNPGRLKTYQFWGMVELMQQMLAGWVGKLLAFFERLILVKHVLCSIPIYNMTVYKWPNFMWSGDPAVKKLVTVKWDEVNTPTIEGGLGLRRLEGMNKAMLMKLLWKIETKEVEWTQFMREKYKNKKNEWTSSYKQSSVLPEIKWVIAEVNEGKRWIVGDGKSISVWQNKWIKDYALIERHETDQYVQMNIELKVADLIVNGVWKIPKQMFNYFERNEVLVIGGGPDKLIWEKDLNGKFSVANTTQQIRKKYPVQSWPKQVWDPCIHPYTSTNLWKILRGACATEKSVRKKGFMTVSKCYLCVNAQDTMTHILWECKFSIMIWHWLGRIFCFPNPSSFEEILKYVKGKSRAIHEVW